MPPRSRPPRPRRTIRSLGPLLVVFPALLGGCEPAPAPTPQPIEIAVVDVVQRDQPIPMDMVGETRGSSDIPIRARVEGVLLGMHFVEGRRVEKDQVLYTIDPEPFEAEVVEAEGALAEVQTQLVKARADLDRIRPLAEIRAVSQSDLDAATAQYDAAVAARQAARARVDLARIKLGYTKIQSPIDGRIGISAARIGEFVGRPPNPVVLNYVSNTDPIRVRFSVDEKTYLSLARRVREFAQTQNAAASATGADPKNASALDQAAESRSSSPRLGQSLELTLSDGTVHPFPGHIVATDAAVNPTTGTFTLEADFPNPAAKTDVVAGQFARVRAIADLRTNALLVPKRAVSELQGSFRVFVIGEDDEVELRPIELGPAVDNFQIVESGVKKGERVAVEIMRLQPGMTVKPRLVALDEKGTIQDSDAEKAASADVPTAS